MNPDPASKGASEPRAPKGATESEARDVAEAAREQSWEKPSFSRELFLGRLRMELIDPFPEESPESKRASDALLEKLAKFQAEKVDADKIDRDGEIAPEVIDGLRQLGAFGITIPKEYGSLGLTKMAYNRAIEMLAAL